MAIVLLISGQYDDEAVFQNYFAAAGHTLLTAADLREGRDAYRRNPCDLVVLAERLLDPEVDWDVFFPPGERASLLLVVTEGAPPAANGQARLRYVGRSALPGGMLDLLERFSGCKDGAGASFQPSDYSIYGCSPQLRQAFDHLLCYARSSASVLLSGPTGTGKELFAKALHAMSPRRGGPFITIDCASLPETLVESLLFGYNRGAFTGATSSREGLIKLADGGTLFLDEVGELSLDIQRKFLRVLQEHKFRSVGGGKETTSDFRVVAATNRHLDSMVASGLFREDLCFRLKILHIELPPLAQREEDVIVIAQNLLRRLCEREGLPQKRLSDDLKRLLLEYQWPGNIRELVNVMEGLFAIAWNKFVLGVEHLPRGMYSQMLRLPRSANTNGPATFFDRRRKDRRRHSDRSTMAPHYAASGHADSPPAQEELSSAPPVWDRRQSQVQPVWDRRQSQVQPVWDRRQSQAPVLWDRRQPAAPPVAGDSLPVAAAESLAGSGSTNGKLVGFSPFREERRRVLENFEKNYLAHIYKMSEGNINEACRLSSLSRPRLYELYRKYGILRDSAASPPRNENDESPTAPT